MSCFYFCDKDCNFYNVRPTLSVGAGLVRILRHAGEFEYLLRGARNVETSVEDFFCFEKLVMEPT